MGFWGFGVLGFGGLPEWCLDDDDGAEDSMPGTFDASGQFRAFKVYFVFGFSFLNLPWRSYKLTFVRSFVLSFVRSFVRPSDTSFSRDWLISFC